MPGQGYIACAHFEDTIDHFGEADTPEKALDGFLKGGEFSDYCDCFEIEDSTYVKVKVFKAIYADTPGVNVEDWEEGWQWVLGDEVSDHQIKCLA